MKYHSVSKCIYFDFYGKGAWSRAYILKVFLNTWGLNESAIFSWSIYNEEYYNKAKHRQETYVTNYFKRNNWGLFVYEQVKNWLKLFLKKTKTNYV
jgi:hypothetical protein